MDTLAEQDVASTDYTDALTIGPKLYDQISVVVQDAPVLAQLWVYGDSGQGTPSVPLGQWGDEVLVQASAFNIGKVGGIRFRGVAGAMGAKVTVYAWRPGEPVLSPGIATGPAGGGGIASVPVTYGPALATANNYTLSGANILTAPLDLSVWQSLAVWIADNAGAVTVTVTWDKADSAGSSSVSTSQTVTAGTPTRLLFQNLGDTVTSIVIASGGGGTTCDYEVAGSNLAPFSSGSSGARNFVANWGGLLPIPTTGPTWRTPEVSGAAATFNLTKAYFRLETAGTGTTTMVIEKMSPDANGVFVVAATVATLSITAGNYETSSAITASVTSGDLLRARFTTVGATGLFTIAVEGGT